MSLKFTAIPVFKPLVAGARATAGASEETKSSTRTGANLGEKRSASALQNDTRNTSDADGESITTSKKVQLDLNSRQTAIMKALAMARTLRATRGGDSVLGEYRQQAKYLDRVIEIGAEEEQKKKLKEERKAKRHEEYLKKKYGDQYVPQEKRTEESAEKSVETNPNIARQKVLAALKYQLRAPIWNNQETLDGAEAKIDAAALDTEAIPTEASRKAAAQQLVRDKHRKQEQMTTLSSKLDDDENDDDFKADGETKADDDLMYSDDEGVEEGLLPVTEETLRSFDVVRRGKAGEVGDVDEIESDLKSKSLPRLGTRTKDAEADAEREERTIFMGNVPIECTDKMLKAFVCQKGTGIESHNIESMRFRSVAVASSKLPRRVAVWKNMTHEQRNSKNAYVVFKPNVNRSTIAAAVDFLHNRVMNDSHHIQCDFSAPTPMQPQRSIFVGNLPFSINEEALYRYFSQVGEVHRVRVVRDPKLLMGKGVGYIEFRSADSVSPAIGLEGDDMEGRPLRVSRMKSLAEQAAEAERARFGRRRERRDDKEKQSRLPRLDDKSVDLATLVKQRQERRAIRDAEKLTYKSEKTPLMAPGTRPQIKQLDDDTRQQLRKFKTMTDEEKSALGDEERRKLRRLQKRVDKREQQAAEIIANQRLRRKLNRVQGVGRDRTTGGAPSALRSKPWMGSMSEKATKGLKHSKKSFKKPGKTFKKKK